MKREVNVAGDEADEAFERMADEQRKFPPDPMRLAYLKYRLDLALGREARAHFDAHRFDDEG